MTDSRYSSCLLPRQILQSWRSTLSTASLTEAETSLCWAGISYALPPLNRHALSQAITFYLQDHQIITTLAPDCFTDKVPVASQAMTSIATSHPLFFAMMHSRGLSLRDNAFHAAARRVLSDYFSNAGHDAEPGILYQDIQQSRDVLKALADIQPPDPPTDGARDRYMIELISQYLLGNAKIAPAPDLQVKALRFQQLYSGINRLDPNEFSCRLPGIRVRQGVSRRSSAASKPKRRHSSLSDELAAVLKRRVAPAPLTDKSEEQLDQKASQPSGWGHGIDQHSYRISSSRSGEKADEGAGAFAKRRAASTMTRADDQAVIRRSQRMAQVDTLLSMSDIQRLTAMQISETLTCSSDTPGAWVMTLLLLSTGMPLNRLQRLTRVETRPGESVTESDSPYWNPEQQLLWYRLLDGPSYAPGATSGLVVLMLPEAINDALVTASLNIPDAKRPLYEARRHLKSLLKRRFRNISGLRPSPGRLTASSWLIIRPFADDDVAALALRGQFDAAYSAPAAYRQLLPGELNALFQPVLTCLMPATRKTDISPTLRPAQPLESQGLSWDAPAQHWVTGSQHAWPVENFRPWFAALRAAFLSAIQAFLIPLRPSDRPPAPLFSAVQYSAAYAYLTLLLATGCRPHAQRVRCELQGEDLWIADKNSAGYQESRVHPAAIELRKTLQTHQQLLSTTRQWLEFQGHLHQDSRVSGQFALPAYLHMASKRQRIVNVMPMTHRIYMQVLAECFSSQQHPQHDTLSQVPRNVTRHSVASFLRPRLPEAQLNALLGHVGSGFRQQAPGSIAPVPRRAGLQTAITELLRTAGFTPLPCEEFLHVLCP